MLLELPWALHGQQFGEARLWKAWTWLSPSGLLLTLFILLFFINPIYHAEMAIYVTHAIGCRDLGSCHYTSSYCPILAATLAVCMSSSGLG